MTDLERRIIPNRVVLPAAVVVLVGAHRDPPVAASGRSPRSAARSSCSLAALAYPGGLGMGDVKLALLLGAALGSALPVALMLGMLAALVPVDRARSPATAPRPARWRSRSRRSSRSAAIVALFAGHQLIHAYLGLA